METSFREDDCVLWIPEYVCAHIFYYGHVYVHNIHYAIIYRLCAHSSATCRFRFKDVLEIGESVKCQIW